MQKEIWKSVEGLHGIEVSNMGNVRSCRVIGSTVGKLRDSFRILRQKDNGRGYKCINIRINGKSKGVYVHHLVAKAFLPNPLNLSEINHLNELKEDNRACNLSWITHKDNCNYGGRNRKCVENRRSYVGEQNPSFGKRWWNDGIRQVYQRDCPENFTKGKLKKCS